MYTVISTYDSVAGTYADLYNSLTFVTANSTGAYFDRVVPNMFYVSPPLHQIRTDSKTATLSPTKSCTAVSAPL
jgi:hypothetical protein